MVMRDTGYQIPYKNEKFTICGLTHQASGIRYQASGIEDKRFPNNQKQRRYLS